MLVLMYLMAIVAANLAVATWGVAADIPVSLVFIAFDLSIRDKMHTQWQGRGLWWRMAVLIITGSAMSYALNTGAGRIAIASCLAFGMASAGDALVFHFLRGSWLWRANGSNIVGAAIDSAVFPAVAFGALMPWIILGQFVAKVLGGAVWSFVFNAGHRT
jgi:hypothetical protein